MALRPRDIAIGYLEPVKDEYGAQVSHQEKGLKWKVRVELPRRGSKRERQRKNRIVYGSERKATVEMNKFVASINQSLSLGTIPSRVDVDVTNLTFGERLEEWLEVNRDNGRLSRITWEKYAGMAKNHIIPGLGHILLREISQYHISRYKEIKLGRGQRCDGGRLATETVNKQLALISNVLEDAAKEKGLIPFNPAKSISRAGGSDKSGEVAANCLTAVELDDLLVKLELLYSLRGACDKKKKEQETIDTLKYLGFSDKEIASPKALHKFKVVQLYPIVYLATMTGMRLSELLALRWKNIDFHQEKIIRVYESSHYGTKENGEESSHHINSTKEKKVKPNIDLSPGDVKFLKLHRQEQLKRRLHYKGSYTDLGLVFSKNDGSHLRNDTVSSEFTAFARSIGVSVTFHGLRHTHITLLLGSGVPGMYVTRRVGHQKTSTTTDYYGHADKTDGPNLGVVFNDVLEQVRQSDSGRKPPLGETSGN